MQHTINLAIQILPTTGSKADAYKAIDAAIRVIQTSGLKYKVCPFETVIEGTYDEVMRVVNEAQQVVFDSGIEHLLVNIKIQRSRNNDVHIEDKMEQYL